MKRLVALCLALLALPLQAADFVPLDRAAAQRLFDPASHRQPTVIALWSADCSHCKKNLQLLSELARSNPRLKVITVAAEMASDEHTPLIARYALPGPRYAYGSDSPEAIAYAIDPSWAGELPRSFLFNGKGGKEKRSGVLSVEAVAQGTGLGF